MANLRIVGLSPYSVRTVVYSFSMAEEAKNVCEEKVFNGIFESHAQDLFNFLHFKYQDEDEAKDLVQEVFGKLWDHCKNVTVDKARGFLFVAANNLMKNVLAKKSTAQKHQVYLAPPQSTREDPQYQMEEDEFRERLHHALNALPEEQRITLLMKRIEGKKQKEIAEQLGISEKAVEKRLYTAMKTLRKQLGNIL